MKETKVSGVVQQLNCPFISTMTKCENYVALYKRSLMIYDQLQLISERFSGTVIGPVCLYLGSQPEQEDYSLYARICLDGISEKFLLKVSCSDCADISLTKQTSADLYLLSGNDQELQAVPLELDMYQLDSLSASHPLAVNVFLNSIERYDDTFKSNEKNRISFDSVNT